MHITYSSNFDHNKIDVNEVVSGYFFLVTSENENRYVKPFESLWSLFRKLIT
jgi:hypothetical protein